MGVVKEVKKVAKEDGRPMLQVAINWVRQNPKARVIPILGARSEKQLKDNLGAIDWTLTEEQYKRLDAASAIDMGFPHGLIKGNDIIFGSTFDKIDNHRV
jgi:aryl-alcohol dehydrogenase-like predicted oxidoreductase